MGKFSQNLTKLNLYLDGTQEEGISFFANEENSLDYQVAIKNSPKHYRQRAKWCSEINKNRNELQ